VTYLVGALLLNGMLSLLGAWAFVAVAARLVARYPAWVSALMVVPFAKLVADAILGLGPNAFARSAFIGSRLDQGRFQLGAGFHVPFFPSLNGTLGARIDEHWYSLSFGEFALHGLSRKLGAGLAPLLLAAIAGVSSWLVLRRLWAGIAFERRRRRERASGTGLERVRVPLRRVDVYVSPAHRGSPFTGGVLRPYVCFPEDSQSALSEAERTAVLEHELAHVRSFDALVLLVVGLLSDVMWFVPGGRGLYEAVRTATERAADHAAVKRGADPEALVRATLLLAAMPGGPPAALAFTRRARAIAARIEALLGPALPPESRPRTVLRVAAVAALLYGALGSTFLT
jgi:Zn-dependent protease with chaperone function